MAKIYIKGCRAAEIGNCAVASKEVPGVFSRQLVVFAYNIITNTVNLIVIPKERKLLGYRWYNHIGYKCFCKTGYISDCSQKDFIACFHIVVSWRRHQCVHWVPHRPFHILIFCLFKHKRQEICMLMIWWAGRF